MPLLFFYLLLTGSGFSMVRAFFMLAIPALFFYLKSQGDALTDLMFIGAAIVLVSPFAIFSISYQMTMLATFGILAFEKARVSLCSLISLKNGRFLPLRHFVRGILTSVSVTLSASVAVLPVQWLVFGEISTLGMFANLLLVPMASLLLSFSLPLLILPFRILAVPAGTVAFLMLRMVEWAADFHSVFSLGYTFVPFVLIPFFAVMTVLLSVRVRRRVALVYLPAVLAAVALTVCFQVHGILTRNTMDTVYCVSGDSESLILSSAGRFALVDVTNGSKRQMRLAYQTLAAHGGTEIEYLVMTHYRNAHASTLSAFTSSYKVRRIYFPVPQNKEEENIYRAVYEMCEEKGIVLKKYDGNGEDELHFFRDVTAVFSPPLYENRSKRPALSFRISCGEGSVYYESAVCSEYRENLGVSETERKGTVLLLGVHGPVPHAEILVEGQFSAVYAANEKIAALTAEKQPPVVAKEVAFLIK